MVNSPVLVRNRCPPTPTKSPMSSSVKTRKSSSGVESLRTYTWMRARPSLSTRKFAFPKLRIARIRPLVRVSIRVASKSSFAFPPCASTSRPTVSVRSKVRG